VDGAINRIFLTNFLSGGITVIDESILTALAQIELPGTGPAQIAVDDRTNVVYVTTGKNFIVALDGLTDQVSGRFNVSGSDQNGTYAIAVDQNQNRVFVATDPGLVVREPDGGTGAVLDTYKLEYEAFEMAVDQQSDNLYVTNYHKVTVLQIAGATPFDVPLVMGIASIIAVVFVVVVALRRGKTKRSTKSVTASGGKLGVLLSQQRRGRSWLR
jgi:DNA-binding beta-propeller fold protein YncE